MKLSWVKALASLFLAALLSAPALAAPDNTALPGTLNFVEGQASIQGRSTDFQSKDLQSNDLQSSDLQNQPLTSKSVGKADLASGQTLTTAADGRAEVLLTPGVFLRLDHDSAVKMISPSLTNTQVELEKGRAEVEVAQLYKQNDIQVREDGANTRLNKVGLYDFSADNNQVRVFKGEALVTGGDKDVKVKAGHELTLNAPKLKAASFNKKADENDFYNWSSLRDEYLSDASANAARMYVGGAGWFGPGWYWDPAFYDYTFLPGAGLLYSPFGPWGFYSPGFIYSYGPYLGYGYYGGPAYWHRPGLHPGLGFRYGHPVAPRSFARAGAAPVGGFRGEGGFAGPSFHGGGFHGAGGGFRH